MSVRRAGPVPLLLPALALLLVLGGCTGDGSPERTDWSPEPRTVDGLSVVASADADGFALHTASGEKTFLPGMNLGSTTPLHQPGEVGGIDATHYRRWLAQMGELGIRVVRIYTLLPPGFYDELARYNRAHPEAPLYLVQGIYLPDESYTEPGATLYDAAVDEAFSAEIADLSAAVHGDLTRAPTPGRASGEYTTDVSSWLAGWIIGVEWDPAGVLRTDLRHAAAAYRPGRYFAATPEATATERWLATHMDELAAAEAARGTSVPIAFVNWPTTDPLVHPTEPLSTEDLVGVDATHVLPTDAWPGGTFASFHAYPYYPDFMRYEPGLAETTWRGEPDRYAGYLSALRDHHADHMPLLVTEFGVPSSLGKAHEGTRDRDQGGHSEQEAMAMDASMMRMMADLGLGGAFVFSWTDEWFKRTWNTMEHQVAETRQLWHDPLTNEQWFGVIATDPDLLADAAAEVSPDQGPIEYAYVRADASWVHLDVKFRERVPERFLLTADVVPGPQRADYRVTVEPGGGTDGAGSARLEVRRELDPLRLDTPARPYHPEQEEPWHLYRLLTNRAYPAVGGSPARTAEYQQVGELRRGIWRRTDHPDRDSTSTWQVDEDQRTIRLRLPWSMLGLADPSSRIALGEGVPADLVEIDGIRFDLGTGDGPATTVDFSWRTWTYTTYTERPKAGLDVLVDAYRDLAP